MANLLAGRVDGSGGRPGPAAIFSAGVSGSGGASRAVAMTRTRESLSVWPASTAPSADQAAASEVRTARGYSRHGGVSWASSRLQGMVRSWNLLVDCGGDLVLRKADVDEASVVAPMALRPIALLSLSGTHPGRTM